MQRADKKSIRDWVESQRENMIRDLMRIVNVESVSDPAERKGKAAPFGEGCKRALEAMLERGSSMGLKASRYEDRVGSLSLRGGEKEEPSNVIGIWSHLDVVPAGEGWHHDPYDAVYDDGLVIGRGAQDNKSAAVMGLYLLKGLKELNIPLEHPAVLYMGCSEECGMQDLDYFLGHYEAPGLSLIADCGFPACYGEKGNMVVKIRAGKKSILEDVCVCAGRVHNIIPDSAQIRFRVGGKTYCHQAEGLAGHSAFPAGSVNAVQGLLESLMNAPEIPMEEKNTLRPFWRLTQTADGSAAGIKTEDALLGDLTCCGTVFAFADGIWELTLDIRYPASADPEWIFRQVRSSAEAQGCLAEQQSHLGAFGLSPGHPVVEKLTGIYNREEGQNDKAYSMAGGTYAAKLPRAIPFGISFPDKSRIREKFPEGHGDYHQPDEAVIVDQVMEALYIYLISMRELDVLLTEYERNGISLWQEND